MITKVLHILDKKQRVQIAGLGVLILLGSVLELLGVSAIMPIVNIMTTPNLLNEDNLYSRVYRITGANTANEFIIFMCIGLAVLFVLKTLFVIFENYIQYKYVYMNWTKLSVEMYKANIRKSYLFHTMTNIAEIQRDISTDVEYVWSTVLAYITVATEGVTVIAIVIFLFIVDWQSTFVLGLLIGVISFAFLNIYRRVSTKVGEENRKASVLAGKWVLQGFGAIKDVKILEKEDSFIGFYKKASKKLANVRIKYGVMGIMPRPILETACILSIIPVIVIKALKGSDLLQFASSLAVLAFAAMRILPSFSKIVGQVNTILYGKASLEHVYEEIDSIRKQNDRIDNEKKTAEHIDIDSTLYVEGISFSYPNSDLKVLNNASCIFEPNKTYGIVGQSGSGKSTFADILLGLIKPDEGDITIKGHSIYDNIVSWHLSVGYIPQTIYLLDDSIRRNVAFGIDDADIDDNKVWEMLEQAQIADFVRSQPNGLETVVGDRGVMLSGGQRQRIGIARALYVEPELLVLDEATSALDNETEEAVVSSIEALHGKMTLIIIAHRLSTIKNCDSVYKVENGKIIEDTATTGT